MYKRRFAMITMLVIVGMALPLSATLAQGPVLDRGKLKGPRPSFPSAPSMPAGAQGGPLAQRNSAVKVMIELHDAPTSRIFAGRQRRGSVAEAQAAARDQRTRIEQAQQRVLNMLSGLNVTVLSRSHTVFNGISVKIAAADIPQIQRLPGVKSVRRLATLELDTSSSVPLIGAPELWGGAGANVTGEGLTIGIIDTGIDYLHTHFGGPGTRYTTNDTTVDERDDRYPSAKVVGGYDFVGDEYDDSVDELSVPQPDPDPMDCNGHGSHVAGIAAGLGVDSDGETYEGPYNADIPFDEIRIGPGVAPAAELYAFRVFGCSGSTSEDIIVAAIERSVDPNQDGDPSDHLDVINMSIGGVYGAAEDVAVVASDNAVLAGVIVVGSAGNEGDTYYITSGPGVATRAIGVASSADATDILDGFRVNSPAVIAGVYPGLNSADFDWTNASPVTGRVVYPASQPTGCEAFNAANRSLIAGKIALIDWTEGECGSAVRTNNAADAGAIGVIMADDSPVFDLNIEGSERIPAISTPKSVGDTIKAQLGENASATLTPEYDDAVPYVAPEVEDTLSNFSARGPRTDAALKPDIAAPGAGTFSAEALSGDEGENISGTSMAAPHVAGAMALLKQLHPDWTVEELKALAMNTANSPIRSGTAAASPLYAPQRVGAGRITLTEAAAADVIAYNADESGSVNVSFGVLQVLDTFSAIENVRIVNKGSEAATYDVTYFESTDVPGVEFSFPSGSTVTVPAGGSAMVQVRLDANAAEMESTRDVTVSGEQILARHWLSEEAGYLVLQPSGGGGYRCRIAGAVCPDIRVPLYSSARPASDMRAEQGTLQSTGETTATLALTGTGVLTGREFPNDIISLVTALELQAVSPNEPTTAGIANNGDLQYVGVTSDFPATGSIEDSMIFFGVSTYGPWAAPTPYSAELDISIDTDRDGEADFVLFNFDLGSGSGSDPSDVFVTALLDVETGELSFQDYVNVLPPDRFGTAIYDSTVMVLPVYASDLGLTDDGAAFDYSVEAFTRSVEGVADMVGPMSYDPADPGFDFTGGYAGITSYPDLPDTALPVEINQDVVGNRETKGVLLLHHHNVPGRQAEAVMLTVDGEVITPFRLYLPLMFNQ